MCIWTDTRAGGCSTSAMVLRRVAVSKVEADGGTLSVTPGREDAVAGLTGFLSDGGAKSKSAAPSLSAQQLGECRIGHSEDSQGILFHVT